MPVKRKAAAKDSASTAAIGFEAGAMCEVRSGTVEMRKSRPFGIRNSAFGICPVPVCFWFLAKDKSGKSVPARRSPQGEVRHRRKQTIFIDARKLGTLIGVRVENPSLN